MNDLLEIILDTLIPASADGTMPGAGSLGLATAVAGQLDEDDEALRAGFEAARACDLASLDLAERCAALEQVERDHPAFIPALYVPACTAYYQHPAVHRGLGLSGEPPHPRGHTLEQGDLTSLERVKERGPLYRIA